MFEEWKEHPEVVALREAERRMVRAMPSAEGELAAALSTYRLAVEKLVAKLPCPSVRPRELEVLAAVEEWVREVEAGRHEGADGCLEAVRAAALDLNSARRFRKRLRYQGQAAQWVTDDG